MARRKQPEDGKTTDNTDNTDGAGDAGAQPTAKSAAKAPAKPAGEDRLAVPVADQAAVETVEEAVEIPPPTETPAASAGQPAAAAAEQTAQQRPVISCSAGLPRWLQDNNASLAFTSYQTGRLYLVGVNDKGQLSIHERFLARAMGLWTDCDRLLLTSLFQVWQFQNIVTADPGPSRPDRHFVPRIAYTTGRIDIHDIGVMTDGRIVFVNTQFSCLAMLSPRSAFRVFWKPPFISRIAAEDRCHLNGMAMKDGAPAYVTATSRCDVINGWRERRAEGGCVIDVPNNTVITEKLSMPHSPRWHGERLWVLNSGTGHLGAIDLNSGAFEPFVFCPGFLRGLAFHNNHAVIGLSLPRKEGAFTGLALDDELKKRDADPWCGLQIVNMNSGDIVEWIRFDSGATELFDVAVMPGVRWPVGTGFLTDDIHRPMLFEGMGNPD